MKFLFADPKLAGIALVCLLLLVVTGVRQYLRSATESTAQLDFRQFCEHDDTVQHCAQKLQTEHKRCFASNYFRGGRFQSTAFDAQQYRQCVQQGYASWNQLRIEKTRNTAKFKRDVLG